jgi:Fe-S-cluster-containing hydrogenase component 2
MCTKICPHDAITVENNLAVIDYEKCTHCGLCATVCPKKLIVSSGELSEELLAIVKASLKK